MLIMEVARPVHPPAGERAIGLPAQQVEPLLILATINGNLRGRIIDGAHSFDAAQVIPAILYGVQVFHTQS